MLSPKPKLYIDPAKDCAPPAPSFNSEGYPLPTHEILIADSILALPEIGVELPFAELYEGIVFGDGPDENKPPAEEPA